MSMSQENLIKILAEMQAKLEKLELENQQLKNGLLETNSKLEEEKLLRIAAEDKAKEDKAIYEQQELIRQQKSIDIHKQHELAQQRIKATYIASLNALDNMGGSKLHHACFAKDYPTIIRLIGEGADVNVKSSTGHTPLDMARKHGFAEVVLLLLAHGANGDKSQPLVYELPIHQLPNYKHMNDESKARWRTNIQSKHDVVAKLLRK